MKPEQKSVVIELTEEEKIITELLQKNDSKLELNELKNQSGLSGKKWDKSMKALSKHNLVKVQVDGDSKMVEFLG